MRDIRDDLQERADACQDQIRAACNHFDRMVQQLQSERDMRVADLKSGLALVERLMKFEDSLMGNVVPMATPSAPPLSLSNRIKA
jgi:hypothetical protein